MTFTPLSLCARSDRRRRDRPAIAYARLHQRRSSSTVRSGSPFAADVVPMHRMQRVEPSGACVVRPTQERRSQQPTRSLARVRGRAVVSRLSPPHRACHQAGLAGHVARGCVGKAQPCRQSSQSSRSLERDAVWHRIDQSVARRPAGGENDADAGLLKLTQRRIRGVRVGDDPVTSASGRTWYRDAAPIFSIAGQDVRVGGPACEGALHGRFVAVAGRQSGCGSARRSRRAERGQR